MRIIVDTEPYYESDCPFYDIRYGKPAVCTATGDFCMYFKKDPELRDILRDCDHLITLELLNKNL